MSEILEVAKIEAVSVAVNVDWFGSEITRTGKIGNVWQPVYHILDITLPSAAVVNVMRSGNQTVTEALNNGVAKAAGALQRASILLNKGDTYNLQYTGIAGPQNVTVRIIESTRPDVGQV